MRILIVDDHPLYRDALARLLPQLFSGAEVFGAERCEQAFDLLRCDSNIDLVLLDIHVPGMNGEEGLMHLRREFPQVRVVMVSANEDAATVQRCLTAGASGFIPKSARTEVMMAALRLVYEGGIYLPPQLLGGGLSTLPSIADAQVADNSLAPDSNSGDERLTRRELEVLQLLCVGQSNKGIANRLGISEATVRAHLSAIFRALSVANRTQAARAALRLGLVKAE